MNKPDFVYAIYIAAPIERVWAALTQGAVSREYWAGREIESAWTLGAPVRFRMADGRYDGVQGEVLAIDPPRHLAITWTYAAAGVTPPPPTRVTFTLEQASPANVRLTVVHEIWAEGSEVEDSVRNGWPAILSSLKSYLETGEALDYTKRWVAEPCKGASAA
ncbi:ATPase [Aliidongia dinghuensis]|uniref:ATPase n=1 Tax=Aliidongia dinghuensis TaxID=1867774 RepID=A0A8J2YX55_9PROT|nr:SRPBCC family protein [Aliidongia dinghuensis]GGF34927.1 ATPase [Aliidongia dinghuensis]